jgi:hypothetical protein
MDVPTDLMELVKHLERRTKEHLAFKRRGSNAHCDEHSRYQPDCVPCIEAAEDHIR